MLLKNYLLYFALFLLTCNSYSQVGIGTTTPSPAAMLEVSSQSNGTGDYKGFMPPRVPDIAARDAISPSVSDYGLLVFVENTGLATSCLQMWIGDSWVDITCYGINTPPVATDVEVVGTTGFGETVTASFSYSDADGDPAGDHTYIWYLANDAMGTGQTVVQTGISNTFDLTAEHENKYIAVEVTPVAQTGESPGLPVMSDYLGPVSDGPLWPAVHNFETTTPDFELPLLSATNGSYSTGTGSNPNSNMFVSPDRGYQVNERTGTVIFGPIDVSSAASATFKLRLASFSKNSGNGADNGDTVTISISTNGGFTYSEELLVKGASANMKWGFDATGSATTSYSGSDTAVEFASSSGTNGISYLEITGIPNVSNLQIKVELLNDHSNEIWVIDDAEVWGN